jgi:hypothetical protein
MAPESPNFDQANAEHRQVGTTDTAGVLRRLKWRQDLQTGMRQHIDATFVAGGSTAPDIVWCPVVSDCITPQTKFLLEHYSTMAIDDRPPPVTKVDPVRFSPALGFVHLVEPLSDGTDFIYRIFGTVVSTVSGEDYSGRTMSALQASGYVIDLGIASCGAVMDRRKPLLVRRRPARAIKVDFWERLILPFFAESGEVKRLLIGVVPVDKSGGVIRPRDGY